DVLGGLRRARRDPRVKALIVKIGGNPIGLATVQELRQAVVQFRASGKQAVAFAETFGEFGAGTVPYFLASAFERIYLQPSGDVGLTGVVVEQRFLKNALDKLGVVFDGAQRHEYKTAANTFTQDHMTEPHRESVARIVESVTEQLVPAKVRELIDRGPFIGAEALEAGLVDALAYRDEVYGEVKRAAGEDAHLQYVSRYHRAAAVRKLPHPTADGIALVHGSGAIRT